MEREGRVDVYEVKCKKSVGRKELFNILYFKNTYKKSNVFLVNMNKVNLNINSLQYFDI